MFVRPGPHPHDAGALLKVRDPMFRLLPDAGADVPETGFWLRRLACGDVVLADPPAAPAPHAEQE